MSEGDRSLWLVRIASGEEAEDESRVGHGVDIGPEAAFIDATPEHLAQKSSGPGFMLGEDVSAFRWKHRNKRSGGVFAMAPTSDGAGDEVELGSRILFLGHELFEVLVVGGDEFGDTDEYCVNVWVVAIERLAGDVGCFGDGRHTEGWSAVLGDER